MVHSLLYALVVGRIEKNQYYRQKQKIPSSEAVEDLPYAVSMHPIKSPVYHNNSPDKSNGTRSSQKRADLE